MKQPLLSLRSWLDAIWQPSLAKRFRVLHRAPGGGPEWAALGGDAGFRRYFRLATEPPLLAVFAPPDSEDSARFVYLAEQLGQRGVATPRIHAAEPQQGFLLIEDFGPVLLSEQLTPERVDLCYGRAMEELRCLQQIDPAELVLAPYDRRRLTDEMRLFPQWFVEGLLGLPFDDAARDLNEALFERLSEAALAQPAVLVHRDFHSRNLVWRDEAPLGVIDFQDAVSGPFTYDLVSLLRDCYVAWPPARVQAWALDFARATRAGGGPCAAACEDEAQFLRGFDWMGLQRHIKVLGIFARLSLRDDKHGYLQDLPRVIGYVEQVAGSYPELAPWSAWFASVLRPEIERQPWYAGAPR